MRLNAIRHEFVEFIPDDLQEGVLYISVRYRTASHLCACGCGTKVATPIKPMRWTLVFNGEAVSLCPSIGRWQQPCRSHYWIENGSVRWAGEWTARQVAAGRERDALDVRHYYQSFQEPKVAVGQQVVQTGGRWARLFARVRKMVGR